MIRGARCWPRAFYDADDRKEGFRLAGRNANFNLTTNREETIMAWTTPTLVEICVGLEINGYLPAEF
jgi:coenzyme PQQ precursor peptide PqqA